MGKKTIIRLKRIFLLIFVFSIPFEYWDPIGISSFFSVTKMAGFGYAAVSFLTIRDSFDTRMFRYVRYLLVFWIWLVILSMYNYIGTNNQSIFNLTLFQNIIFYWLVASDLKKGNIKIKSLMLAFVASVILMNVLLSMGIGIGEEFVEDVSRITFFGNNPNIVGLLSGLAIVFSLFFMLNPQESYGKKSYLFLLVIPVFVNLLMQSGSRGALITTAFSVGVMFIMNKTVSYKKILQYGLFVIAVTYFMDQLVESQLMYKRITQFIEEGNTAGRGDIWKSVIDISIQRPLIGYGTTGFENEMVSLFGRHKDAHNLFLYILVTTGFLGLSLFMYFLYFHIRTAIRSFRRDDVMKIVLFIFYMTTVIKAGGVINNKLMWLLLAIIISASFMGTQTRLHPAHSRLRYSFT